MRIGAWVALLVGGLLGIGLCWWWHARSQTAPASVEDFGTQSHLLIRVPDARYDVDQATAVGDTLWFVADKAVYSLDDGRPRRRYHAASQPLRLHRMGTGILVSAGGELLSLSPNGGTRELLTLPHTITGLVEHGGTHWVGTLSGLAEAVKEDRRLVVRANHLEGRTIDALLVSDSGTLWVVAGRTIYWLCEVAAECPGALVSDDRRWAPLSKTLPAGIRARALHQTGDLLWILTRQDTGLYEHTDKPVLVAESERSVRTLLGHAPVEAVLATSVGTFVGTRQGLSMLEAATPTQPPQDTPSSQVPKKPTTYRLTESVATLDKAYVRHVRSESMAGEAWAVASLPDQGARLHKLSVAGEVEETYPGNAFGVLGKVKGLTHFRGQLWLWSDQGLFYLLEDGALVAEPSLLLGAPGTFRLSPKKHLRVEDVYYLPLSTVPRPSGVTRFFGRGSPKKVFEEMKNGDKWRLADQVSPRLPNRPTRHWMAVRDDVGNQQVIDLGPIVRLSWSWLNSPLGIMAIVTATGMLVVLLILAFSLMQTSRPAAMASLGTLYSFTPTRFVPWLLLFWRWLRRRMLTVYCGRQSGKLGEKADAIDADIPWQSPVPGCFTCKVEDLDQGRKLLYREAVEGCTAYPQRVATPLPICFELDSSWPDVSPKHFSTRLEETTTGELVSFGSMRDAALARRILLQETPRFLILATSLSPRQAETLEAFVGTFDGEALLCHTDANSALPPSWTALA